MLAEVLLCLFYAGRQQQEAVPPADVAAVTGIGVRPAPQWHGVGGDVRGRGEAGKRGTQGEVAALCPNGRSPRSHTCHRSRALPALAAAAVPVPHMNSSSSSARSSGVENSVSLSLMGSPAARARSRPALGEQR